MREHHFVAEALALRYAFWIAKGKRFKNLYMEGDSGLVIDAIQGTCAIPWRLKNVTEDIKWLASSYESISWKHVLREANFLADAITRAGFSINNFYIWDRTFVYMFR